MSTTVTAEPQYLPWGYWNDDDDHQEFRNRNATQCRFCRILMMTNISPWHLEYCPKPSDAVGIAYWRTGYEDGRSANTIGVEFDQLPVDEYLLGLFLGTLDRMVDRELYI